MVFVFENTITLLSAVDIGNHIDVFPVVEGKNSTCCFTDIFLYVVVLTFLFPYTYHFPDCVDIGCMIEAGTTRLPYGGRQITDSFTRLLTEKGVR